MVMEQHIERLSDPGPGNQLLPRLIEFALSATGQTAFLNQAVEQIETWNASSQGTVLLRGIKGTWRTLAAFGSGEHTLPYELLANALDQDRLVQQDQWLAMPVDIPNQSGRILVQLVENDSDAASTFPGIVSALSIADSVARHRLSPTRKSERLSAILDFTARWNQSRETDQLLEEIAEAATRLLSAERASIFLPDSSGQQLIGKPATGVEGGQIQIPMGVGVVGAVIDSGQPQRVDSDIADEQKQINREVDEALDFETRTLLCVPMKNSEGTTIGAFELINRLHGNFTDEDQSALAELAAHAAVAIETTKHVEQLETTTKVVADEAAEQVQLIGECGQIEELKKTIERVAHTDLAILITGENGTGKEVVAQLIHYLSDRRDKVLVAVNCAAITESLLESELFGHEKGAFTGATQRRVGRFEQANGGTLFLDEIGDMPAAAQTRLLRVLAESEFYRVGGHHSVKVDVRIIAATHQNLEALVTQGSFREDLYHRLNVIRVHVPSLADRRSDIPALADYFLENAARDLGDEVKRLAPETQEYLTMLPWPGNVRQLENACRWLHVMASTRTILIEDLPQELQADTSTENGSDWESGLRVWATQLLEADDQEPLLEAAMPKIEKLLIEVALRKTSGRKREASELLGWGRNTLTRKMQELDLD